jgi:hypothetical protein
MDRGGSETSVSLVKRGRHETHRRGDGDRGTDNERGTTSWSSVIFGWLAVLGASLISSGIVAALVGAILGVGGASSSATEGGTAGLIGLLITLLLAFSVGG